MFEKRKTPEDVHPFLKYCLNVCDKIGTSDKRTEDT